MKDLDFNTADGGEAVQLKAVEVIRKCCLAELKPTESWAVATPITSTSLRFRYHHVPKGFGSRSQPCYVWWCGEIGLPWARALPHCIFHHGCLPYTLLRGWGHSWQVVIGSSFLLQHIVATRRIFGFSLDWRHPWTLMNHIRSSSFGLPGPWYWYEISWWLFLGRGQHGGASRWNGHRRRFACNLQRTYFCCSLLMHLVFQRNPIVGLDIVYNILGSWISHLQMPKFFSLLGETPPF